jgi:hypothetical protein
MEKPTTPEPKTSSTWEHLEAFVRGHVQQFIQALLEEESRSYWDARNRLGERLSMRPLDIAMAMVNPDA